MKATKKPVTIECFKYDGDLINSDGKFYVPYFKDQGEMYIKTLEGDHHASVNGVRYQGRERRIVPL